MTKRLDFCDLKFFEGYVLCEVRQGATVTPEKSKIQTEAILDYYKDQPFVYITHRQNSYAVDPRIYSKSSKIENLLGFAVVSLNINSIKSANFEKFFFNKPFETFTSINDAIEWAEALIENEKSSFSSSASQHRNY